MKYKIDWYIVFRYFVNEKKTPTHTNKYHKKLTQKNNLEVWNKDRLDSGRCHLLGSTRFRVDDFLFHIDDCLLILNCI